MEKTEKYWADYTAFLNAANTITSFSPADLLDFYSDFVTALEKKDFDNYTIFEFEYENDFHFRALMQQIITHPSLPDNELNKEFLEKVASLDERMKPFLSEICSKRPDWYIHIDLEPGTFRTT